ncbi:hypothetical protein HYV21_00710 [Candidatus Microgenomates bacterium]|nr:hypothetical protein [Candidatus Microgenomates bacterium]
MSPDLGRFLPSFLRRDRILVEQERVSEISQGRFRLRDREVISVSNLSLEAFLLTLSKHAQEPLIITVITGRRDLNVLVGSFYALPIIVITDGEVRNITPIRTLLPDIPDPGWLDIQNNPSYVAWIAKEPATGDPSPYYLQSQLPRQDLKQMLRSKLPPDVSINWKLSRQKVPK